MLASSQEQEKEVQQTVDQFMSQQDSDEKLVKENIQQSLVQQSIHEELDLIDSDLEHVLPIQQKIDEQPVQLKCDEWTIQKNSDEQFDLQNSDEQPSQQKIVDWLHGQSIQNKEYDYKIQHDLQVQQNSNELPSQQNTHQQSYKQYSDEQTILYNSDEQLNQVKAHQQPAQQDSEKKLISLDQFYEQMILKYPESEEKLTDLFQYLEENQQKSQNISDEDETFILDLINQYSEALSQEIRNYLTKLKPFEFLKRYGQQDVILTLEQFIDQQDIRFQEVFKPFNEYLKQLQPKKSIPVMKQNIAKKKYKDIEIKLISLSELATKKLYFDYISKDFPFLQSSFTSQQQDFIQQNSQENLVHIQQEQQQNKIQPYFQVQKPIAQVLEPSISDDISKQIEYYQSTSQQAKTIFLEKLIENSSQVFFNLTEFLQLYVNDSEAQVHLEMLQDYLASNKIDMCNNILFNQYQKNKVKGFWLYMKLLNKTKIQQIQSPLLRADEIIQWQDVHDQLNSLNQQAKSNTLKFILIQIKSEEYLDEVVEKLLQLQKEDLKVYQESFKNIFYLQPKLRQIFYTKLAPPSLQILISRIFQEIMKSQNNWDRAQIQVIYDQIFLEDDQFGSKFLSQLQIEFPILNDIKKPKGYKELQLEALNLIRQQLVKNSSRQFEFEIKEFMSLDTDQDIQQLEKDIQTEYSQQDTIQIDKICILLFDYVKRRYNFSSIINMLSATRKSVNVNKHILMNLLLKQSNQYLRTLILMACSQFMPVPLYGYDWDIQDQRCPLLWSELFYTFEKKSALITFKIASNEYKGPQGSTSLINQIMFKDFQVHSGTPVSYGTIDLQFDYDFDKPQYLPVADVQGYLDFNILRNFYQIFDTFVIHVMENEKDIEILNREIVEILEVVQNARIIIIRHDPKIDQINIQHQPASNKYTFKIKPFQHLLEQIKTDLVLEIRKIILDDPQLKKDYKGKVEKRIRSLEGLRKMNVVLKAALPPQINFDIHGQQDTIEKVKAILDLIQIHSNDLHSEDFTPQNSAFRSFCHITRRLLEESEITTADRQQLIQNKEELIKVMKSQKQPQCLRVLQKIIEFDNFLGISSIIAKFMKGYLDNKVMPLLEERTILRGELEKPDQSDEDKEKIKEKMVDVTQKLEKKFLSIEYIYRELYLQGIHQQSVKPEYYNLYKELAEKQIAQGQPFELIDGNNLHFISEVYDKIYDEIDDNVLIVSVIGPQSAGKSLLLNFLFGTQFMSAAGRCTKGVYGTILTLKSQNEDCYKKILLLDTEGIQAAEGRDEKFDKRIVFYIFCVSHVVLILNKGEMNHQMSEIIKLASDAIVNLKENKVLGMSVNIVMNMLAQTNSQALEESIQKLSNELIQIQEADKEQKNSKQKLTKLFSINKENVFLLPYAFQPHGQGMMKVNKPSEDFSNQLVPLRKAILERAIHRPGQSKYTLSEWFNFAHDSWEFTRTFKGITEYTTLEQRREDQKLQAKLNQLIEESFDKQRIQHGEQVVKIIEDSLKQYRGACEVGSEVLTSQVRKQIRESFNKVTSKVLFEYKDFCSQSNISIDLRNKRESQLIRRMSQYQTEWETSADELIAKFTSEKAKVIGDERLQKFIQKALKENEQISVEEAILKFDEAWADIQNQLRLNIMRQPDTTKNEVFKLVQQYYKNVFAEKQIEDTELELQTYQNFQNNGLSGLENFLKNQAKSFLFFKGDQIRPNINKVLQIQDKNKKYLTLQNRYFEPTNHHIYFRMQEFIDENFLKDHFIDQLWQAFDKGKSQIFFGDFKFELNPKKIQEILNKLQVEVEYFNLRLKQETRIQLEQLDKTLNVFKEEFQQEQDRLRQQQHRPEMNQHKFIQKPKKQDFNDQKLQQAQKFKDEKELRNLFLYLMNHFIVNDLFDLAILEQSHTIAQRVKKLKFEYFKADSPTNFKKKTIEYHQKLKDQKNLIYLKAQPVVILSRYILSQSNQYLKGYIQYIKNPNQNQVNSKSQEAQAAIQHFFSQFNLQSIIKKIESIVLSKFKVDGKYEQNLDYWLNLLRGGNNDARIKFREFQSQIVQDVARDIINLINEIDEEIEPFCLQISDSGNYHLHLIGQLLINALQESIQLHDDQKPLEIFNSHKQAQQNMFVAKVTSDDKQKDKALAQLIKQEIINFVEATEKQTAFNMFQQQTQNLAQFFEKTQIIKDIEEFATGQVVENVNIRAQDVVQFYVNPKSWLENKFYEIWRNKTDDTKNKALINYQYKVQSIYNICTSYFKALHQLIIERKANEVSLSLFITEQDKQIADQMISLSDIDSLRQRESLLSKQNVDQNEKFKYQKCAATYLISVMNQTWTQDQIITVENIQFVLHPRIILPSHQDIGFQLEQPILSLIIPHLTKEGISRINYFLEELINFMENHQISQLDESKIIGDVLGEFKNKFIGCHVYCPLCRRQCDVQHEKTESVDARIHNCISGHQLQCFGGNRHFSTDEALTLGCFDLKNHHEVIYNQETITWVNFKKNYKNWHFGMLPGSQKALQTKNIEIWNKYGREICEYYNNVEKVGIVYKDALPAANMQSIHYIFMMDDSGSMNGRPWKDLMNAFYAFLTRITKDKNLQACSKITVIQYNSSSKVIFQNETPSLSLIDRLKFEGGDTCFDPPLQDALTVTQKYFQGFDQFVWCLMTDGGANYPQQALKQILSTNIGQKASFRAIGFGKGVKRSLLNQIAKALNGRVEVEVKPEALALAFVKLIPNLYQA